MGKEFPLIKTKPRHGHFPFRPHPPAEAPSIPLECGSSQSWIPKPATRPASGCFSLPPPAPPLHYLHRRCACSRGHADTHTHVQNTLVHVRAHTLFSHTKTRLTDTHTRTPPPRMDTPASSWHTCTHSPTLPPIALASCLLSRWLCLAH